MTGTNRGKTIAIVLAAVMALSMVGMGFIGSAAAVDTDRADFVDTEEDLSDILNTDEDEVRLVYGDTVDDGTEANQDGSITLDTDGTSSDTEFAGVSVDSERVKNIVDEEETDDRDFLDELDDFTIEDFTEGFASEEPYQIIFIELDGKENPEEDIDFVDEGDDYIGIAKIDADPDSWAVVTIDGSSVDAETDNEDNENLGDAVSNNLGDLEDRHIKDLEFAAGIGLDNLDEAENSDSTDYGNVDFILEEVNIDVGEGPEFVLHEKVTVSDDSDTEFQPTISDGIDTDLDDGDVEIEIYNGSYSALEDDPITVDNEDVDLISGHNDTDSINVFEDEPQDTLHTVIDDVQLDVEEDVELENIALQDDTDGGAVQVDAEGVTLDNNYVESTEGDTSTTVDVNTNDGAGDVVITDNTLVAEGDIDDDDTGLAIEIEDGEDTLDVEDNYYIGHQTQLAGGTNFGSDELDDIWTDDALEDDRVHAAVGTDNEGEVEGENIEGDISEALDDGDVVDVTAADYTVVTDLDIDNAETTVEGPAAGESPWETDEGAQLTDRGDEAVLEDVTVNADDVELAGFTLEDGTVTDDDGYEIEVRENVLSDFSGGTDAIVADETGVDLTVEDNAIVGLEGEYDAILVDDDDVNGLTIDENYIAGEDLTEGVGINLDETDDADEEIEAFEDNWLAGHEKQIDASGEDLDSEQVEALIDENDFEQLIEWYEDDSFETDSLQDEGDAILYGSFTEAASEAAGGEDGLEVHAGLYDEGDETATLDSDGLTILGPQEGVEAPDESGEFRGAEADILLDTLEVDDGDLNHHEIDGLHLQAASSSDRLVHVKDSQSQLDLRNTIIDGAADDVDGIFLEPVDSNDDGTNDIHIEDNRIETQDADVGLSIDDANEQNQFHIHGNAFLGDTVADGTGIDLSSAADSNINIGDEENNFFDSHEVQIATAGVVDPDTVRADNDFEQDVTAEDDDTEPNTIVSGDILGSIDAAIDEADDFASFDGNALVVVGDGTYEEDVSVQLSDLETTLIIQGAQYFEDPTEREGAESTIEGDVEIDSGNNDEDIRFDGFEIDTDAGTQSIDVTDDQDNVVTVGNNSLETDGDTDWGITINLNDGSSELVVDQNQIDDAFDEGGVEIASGSDGEIDIEANTIANTDGDGVEILDDSDHDINVIGNVIENHDEIGVALGADNDDVVVRSNDIESNDIGVEVTDEVTDEAEDYTVEANTIADNDESEIKNDDQGSSGDEPVLSAEYNYFGDERGPAAGADVEEGSSDAEIVYEPFLAVPHDSEDIDVDADNIDQTEEFALDVIAEAGDVTTVAFPDDPGITVEEAFGDTDATIYNLTADGEYHEQDLGDDVNALEAYVVIHNEEDEPVSIQFDRSAGESEATLDLNQGWNLVGSPLSGNLEETGLYVGEDNDQIRTAFEAGDRLFKDGGVDIKTSYSNSDVLEDDVDPNEGYLIFIQDEDDAGSQIVQVDAGTVADDIEGELDAS